MTSNQFPSPWAIPHDGEKLFTPKQIALIKLLREGRFTALEISGLLKIGDSRSEIRNIRNKGVVVSDARVNSCNGGKGRQKLYWIEKS